MKRRTVGLLGAFAVFLLTSSDGNAAGFVWNPSLSNYEISGEGGDVFYALNSFAAAAAGLGTGAGYGTVAPDGIGNPLSGTTAYGGPAPASLVSQGINERPGHYYFGFANTYPNTDNFSAYELGGTVIQPFTTLRLMFLRTTTDPINFIGFCGDPTVSHVYLANEERDGKDYLYLEVEVGNPVYSTKGGGDQDSVFGLYINYGSYDDDNVGVDYDGAIFGTDIHWWDIDVPAIPQDKLASIHLSTQGGTEARIGAIIPDSYFDRIGLDPDTVSGYVDENELPLGQGLGETYAFTKNTYPTYACDFNLDGSEDRATIYTIYNDQWSGHDIGVGAIPEPTMISLLIFGFGGFVLMRKRFRGR